MFKFNLIWRIREKEELSPYSVGSWIYRSGTQKRSMGCKYGFGNVHKKESLEWKDRVQSQNPSLQLY